ncbi:molybdopterin-synthase adenylyltransferase MoeB [Paraferrimonas sedimenticola]|uniref:Molybdopterin-synthase adenylyltransferase n=1 Tax=Paraferrimonas sedimenticola TaxID=375674 RepID=A0AA37RV17_9GAMM|nr:molybdopterin-synthase adenylyltransferase MoeB [Paraferrimonas sedimenticola]GLP95399.1 molybdopterin-synthase adenylyltransferase MoeB [Paraferrimonas sedimenticola]
MMEDILTDSELVRYSRQISIQAMDIDGQEALKQAKVLVVGLGGLGCPAAQYLTVAGIGKMTLVDFDTVELSNLQRQVLHKDSRIGMAKVDSAVKTLSELNPLVELNAINARLDEAQMAEQVAQHDVVLDCTDNVDVRQMLNRLCFSAKKPLVSAAAIRMEGLLTVFDYSEGAPCYECFSALFGEQHLTCVESGILAPVVGTVGTLQALEAIKLITGMGKVLSGRVLMIDAMTMQFNEFKLGPNPSCAVCAKD